MITFTRHDLRQSYNFNTDIRCCVKCYFTNYYIDSSNSKLFEEEA